MTVTDAERWNGLEFRHLAVAAWFGWLWLAGFLAATGWFAWFYLPVLTRLVAWAAAGLATSPATGTFWITIACIAVLTRRYGIPAILTFRAIRRAPRHAALRGRRD